MAAAKKQKSSGAKTQASIFDFFGKKKAAMPSTPAASPVFKTHSVNRESQKQEKQEMQEKEEKQEKQAKQEKPLDIKKEEPVQLETPLTSSQDDSDGVSSPASSPTSENSRNTRRRVNYSELSDDEEISVSKRRRVKVVDSDSEEEFKPEESGSESDENDADVGDIDSDNDEELTRLLEEHDKSEASRDASSDEDTNMEDAEIKTEAKPKEKANLSAKYNAKSNYSASREAKIAPRSAVKPPTAGSKFKKQNDERYQWLVNIKDAEKRPESDPNYDCRTLYVPSSAWNKFTPFETQYWQIKSKMWDSVVFFKKGKFYELYEKDAILGHTLFDLKLAGTGRANMQLAGIPEMSFDYWASEFIKKGYKVAKVDQKETLLAKQISERNSGKKEAKIIERELKCVLTAGTLTQEGMLTNDMATYCLSIYQDQNSDGSCVFGIAVIDTAVGNVQILQFNDDSECTNLETFVNQIKPKEVIACRGNLSALAAKIVKFNCESNCLWNLLKPQTEFWDSDTTLENLCSAQYFPAKDLDDTSNWPPVLVDYSKSKPVGFSAFGGLLSYLKSLKLDQSLISIGNIEEYKLYQSVSSLILDGQTLQNLEIFSNSFDGSDKGTLFKLINRAITAFGKRTLKTWVCHPLYKIEAINDRLDAVDGLLKDGMLIDVLVTTLKKLPDLERMLARIHAGSLKVKDFASVIDSFNEIKKLVTHLINEYGSLNNLPGVLSKFFLSIPQNLNELVDEWENAIDYQKAVEQDLLIPEPGVEPDFDKSSNLQKSLEDQLLTLLRSYKREYGSQEICFKDSGKEIFLIEVPTKCVKKIPKSWITMGSTAKNKRFWSPEVKELVQQLNEAREIHKKIVETLKSKIYKKFDNNYSLWLNTVHSIANIDCLVSLASTSEFLGEPSCRPELVESSQAILNFEELRHPCFSSGGVSGSKEFIPNDIQLGGESAKLGLLTGANAAGKSTVLRMTCVGVILAQLGCHVPAVSAQLTPIDRIMTRLGANDNLIQGKSTFYVEMSETKRILESATPKSLLVLDELGRGGSSSDGFAIAEAVLYHIANHIQSVGFFATHYASLGLPFKHHPLVKPLRMAILADEKSRNVTFLYRLEDGAAAGSFGMNVASMCGINKQIIDDAETAAKELEHTSRLKKANALADLSEEGIALGLQSDFAWLLRSGLDNKEGSIGEGSCVYDEEMGKNVLKSMFSMIEGL